MASAAIAPGSELHQEALPDFILVRADEVDEGERLRPVDPVWAKVLGGLMARDGQQTPIQVARLPGRNRWTLVAGGHRLAGAMAVGIEHLRAEIVGAGRDSRRLREVTENLWRRDLAPIERAAFIAELVQLKRAQAGLAVVARRDAQALANLETISKSTKAEAAETMETISNVYGWSDEVGEQLGLTGRTIRNDLMIFRGLPPSLVERLRAARHPILGNAAQLRALAKLETATRERVVDKLLGTVVNGKSITSVAVALGLIGQGRPLADPETRRFSTVIATLQRMSATELNGLLQSPLFHRELPAQARDLLAPILREEEADAPNDSSDTARRDAAGMARHGQATGTGRTDPVGGDRVDSGESGSVTAHDLALARRSGAAGSDDAAERALLWLTRPENAELDPDYLIAELPRRFGGAARFANGTCELRVGRVKATCTAGGAGLVRAWLRAAAVRPTGQPA